MNANLQPQMPQIKTWVNEATVKLQSAGVSSPRLDSELILAGVINKDRTYLHGHDNETINQNLINKANKYLDRRANHEPLAYILGYKEFFGHKFKVSNVTLIPRPESETIIEFLYEMLEKDSKLKLVDIGTGSGCLGVTAKLSFPNLDVTLTDISDDTLKIAKQNSIELGANVKFKKCNLLKGCDEVYDIIIANLPYVDNKWTRSPETDYEPRLALFSKDNGLYLIKELIKTSKHHLVKSGHLIIEADPCQHENIIKFASEKSFKNIRQADYVLMFKLDQTYQYSPR